MADEAEKPQETALPAPVSADVPVEAPVTEGADAPISVVEAVAAEEPPAPAAAPKAQRKPATKTAPAPTAQVEAPVAAPVEELPVAETKEEPVKAALPKSRPAKAEPVAKTPVVKPKPVKAKVRAAKAAKPVLAPAARPAKKTTKSVTKPKVVAPPTLQPKLTPTKPRIAAKPASSQIKDTFTMAKTLPTDFIASFQTAFSDFQTKAAGAYEKSTSVLGEANEFAKGNVEAVVESGKILASGLQELGTTFVADSRSAFDTLTAEVKDLAAVKTPAEFFSLQGTLARKNFDTAVAQASKSTEAFLKLANDVLTPLSGRVTLAVEKVSKAA
ncbi:phasin family protein [Novosphingobium flavum]|uniref:Phasin family protein n=1 Tax=Novosphingobium flavum TaxID=1778672 RepID=A0A7X1KKA1_9SPHN|nr:phasin family protein [Novosphingobium flavum]MBC2664316.1 phasin family protein [Novosphingobium flavum]